MRVEMEKRGRRRSLLVRPPSPTFAVTPREIWISRMALEAFSG